MASIKLVLVVKKIDASGHCPLYIRVIKDRKVKYVSTGVKLKVNEWDEDKQRVKKNKENSARMNAFLASKIADAESLVADEERKSTTVSVKKLKRAIKGMPSVNFFQYVYKRLETLKGSLSIKTASNYKKYTQKFEKFIGHRDVNFDDISVTLLNDYVSYMGNKLENGATTQNYSLLVLSIMFKAAMNEDLIPETMYPFSKVKVKKEKGKRLYLSKEQFRKFKEFDLEPMSKEDIYRDMFMFSVFAGGLRFSDVLSLKWKEYNQEEQRISKVIRKTGRLHALRIGEDAVAILNKYKTTDATKNDFIFPLIPDVDFFDKNIEYQQKMIDNNTSLCGIRLRKIGKDLELPFTLSFHLSRHTFATNALNNGMRIEYVSKLLDHTDIGITQIYAKIISEELDKAVDNFVKM
ncbi:tyrosine-type recombinase/integrase [Chryseobacterium sp. T1]